MIRRLKRAIYRIACLAGVHHVSRLLNRRKLLIVAYHGLRDGPPPPGTSWALLPVQEFERQVRYLRRHYRVLPIDQALDELWSGGLRESTACITFDDGYRSNLTLGLPILRALDLPATVYLTTGLIGTPRLIWTIELDMAFQQSSRKSLDLGSLCLGRVELTDTAQRARAARDVIARLKPLAPAERDLALEGVRAELGLDELDHNGAFTLMTWDEVVEMDISGLVSFGAHTVNHELVSRLDDDSVRYEIGDSVIAVRERVSNASRTFAYPNGTAGDFDERAAGVLQSLGEIGAVSTIEGLSTPVTDRYALHRINIGSEMRIHEFSLLTSGVLRRRARA